MTLLHSKRAESVALNMTNASHFLMNQLKEDMLKKTKSHRESLWLREGVYIAYCRTKGNDFPRSRQKMSILEMSLPPIPVLGS